MSTRTGHALCLHCFAVLSDDESEHYVYACHPCAKAEPDVFVPVKGAWGRRGATSVHLQAARKQTLSKAIEAAWRNTAPKRLVGKA